MAQAGINSVITLQRNSWHGQQYSNVLKPKLIVVVGSRVNHIGNEHGEEHLPHSLAPCKRGFRPLHPNYLG
jgi:hypothetical protein